MIFISTGGWPSQTAVESSTRLIEHGLTDIELSGGRHCPNSLDELKCLTKQGIFQIHNYFPPPRRPFVLNLATDKSDLADTCIKHIQQALEWSVELHRPVYSFHAGFLIDPDIRELGQKIGKKRLMERSSALNRFIDRTTVLAQRAESLGVSLLVENNVLSTENMAAFGENPFLMIDASECEYVMKNTPENVNLLVDVAHLKVSAQSLGFNPVDFLQRCNTWIQAYHLSDNSGSCDSNDPIAPNAWFWPHLKNGLDYYSLEIYGVSIEHLAAQREIAATALMHN